MSDQEQEQLPDAAPVELADDDEQAAVEGDTSPTTAADDLGREQDDPELRAWLERDVHDTALAAQELLRDRELEDGAKVSASTVGSWAVYDNHELRFWPGLKVRDTREQAQADLDEVKPTTGHDLVVVEV